MGILSIIKQSFCKRRAETARLKSRIEYLEKMVEKNDNQLDVQAHRIEELTKRINRLDDETVEAIAHLISRVDALQTPATPPVFLLTVALHGLGAGAHGVVRVPVKASDRVGVVREKAQRAAGIAIEALYMQREEMDDARTLLSYNCVDDSEPLMAGRR
jgi:hypothetical protein